MNNLRTLGLGLALLVAFFVSQVPGQEYGEKVVNFGTEIFYKGDVTEEDATKLGVLLKESEFSDGTSKSVQILKEDGVWQFRMVVLAEFLEDEAMQQPFKHMCLELSAHFEGDEVVVHLCDDELKTIKVVTGLQGKLSMVDAAQLYHCDITDEQLENLSEFIKNAGLAANPVTFYAKKKEDQIDFRMVVIEQFYDDEEILIEVKEIATMMSKEVFEGGQLEFHLCDDSLKTRNSVKVSEKN